MALAETTGEGERRSRTDTRNSFLLYGPQDFSTSEVNQKTSGDMGPETHLEIGNQSRYSQCVESARHLTQLPASEAQQGKGLDHHLLH